MKVRYNVHVLVSGANWLRLELRAGGGVGGAVSQKHFISMVIKVPLPLKKQQGPDPHPYFQLPALCHAPLFEFVHARCAKWILLVV